MSKTKNFSPPRTVVAINSRKYDGTLARTWTAELIRQEGPELVFIGIFAEAVEHAELGAIKQGTISYEYYWLDRWYNVFAFFEPDGQFRNHYCNVNMPPAFNGQSLDYVDLDLDVVAWPDGSCVTLDEDEFAANAARFGYPDHVRSAAASAMGEILALVDERRLPLPHHKL